MAVLWTLPSLFYRKPTPAFRGRDGSEGLNHEDTKDTKGHE
jgi:hypothetical protein